MDETDFVLANTLDDWATDNDLKRCIMKHALIVQCLVCQMAREVQQTEAGIRTLYDTWADMAVEQFRDPRAFADRKCH